MLYFLNFDDYYGSSEEESLYELDAKICQYPEREISAEEAESYLYFVGNKRLIKKKEFVKYISESIEI